MKNQNLILLLNESIDLKEQQVEFYDINQRVVIKISIDAQNIVRYYEDGVLNYQFDASQSSNYVGYGYVTSDTKVGIAQRLLEMNNYLTGADIDFNFGPKTYNAVVSFQNAHGLSADGIVGVSTLRALIVYGPN